MNPDQIIHWLLDGDVSIQYQTHRDLLGEDRPDLRARMATEGWGAQMLQARHANGHWGEGFYQPKWISTHYSLLDLANLDFPPDHPAPQASVALILRENVAADGGVNPARSIAQSDVCINGMFLTYACHFHADPDALRSIVDFVIGQQMADGGFNCRAESLGGRA